MLEGKSAWSHLDDVSEAPTEKAVQEVYNTSRRDQFLMKLLPKFEVVR
ncbi:hypothetical protein A2U01_0018184, partial [Trifolium medium]|nr:hypothetical protein [Trifolium medium]